MPTLPNKKMKKRKKKKQMSTQRKADNTDSTSMGVGTRKIFMNHMYGKEGPPVDYFWLFNFTFIK